MPKQMQLATINDIRDIAERTGERSAAGFALKAAQKFIEPIFILAPHGIYVGDISTMGLLGQNKTYCSQEN